jgi:hypothetical protein
MENNINYQTIVCIHNIVLTPMHGYNPYDKSIRELFSCIWNRAVNKYAETLYKDIDEFNSFIINENNYCIIDGNNYTITFKEDKEIPEDNHLFISLLHKYSNDNLIQIISIDNVTHQKVSFN